MINRLKKLEIEFNKVNSDNNCIYCKSKEYNGNFGILHSDDCPINELRLIIKKLQINNYNINKKRFFNEFDNCPKCDGVLNYKYRFTKNEYELICNRCKEEFLEKNLI